MGFSVLYDSRDVGLSVNVLTTEAGVPGGQDRGLQIPDQPWLPQHASTAPTQPPTTKHTVFFKHKVNFFFFFWNSTLFQVHGIKISRQTQMQLSAARGIPQLGLSKAKTGSLRGRSQPCCVDLGRVTVFPEHFTLTGYLISCRPCKYSGLYLKCFSFCIRSGVRGTNVNSCARLEVVWRLFLWNFCIITS